jgi:hypothetical protein
VYAIANLAVCCCSKSDEELSASAGGDDTTRGALTDVDSCVSMSCADVSDGEDEDEIDDDSSPAITSSSSSTTTSSSRNPPVSPLPPITPAARQPPPPPKVLPPIESDPNIAPPRIAPQLADILQAAAQLKQASQDFQDSKIFLDNAIANMERGSLLTALADLNQAIWLLRMLTHAHTTHTHTHSLSVSVS